MRLKLAIEPKPVSTWGITLANRLTSREWSEIRTRVYRNASYQCEVCTRGDSKLHTHECWVFDDRRRIQHLAGFQCLCRKCHDVKHFGRSSQVYSKKYQEELIEHWCKVNGKTKEDFQRHLTEIHAISKKRMMRQYIVKVGRRILV